QRRRHGRAVRRSPEALDPLRAIAEELELPTAVELAEAPSLRRLVRRVGRAADGQRGLARSASAAFGVVALPVALLATVASAAPGAPRSAAAGSATTRTRRARIAVLALGVALPVAADAPRVHLIARALTIPRLVGRAGGLVGSLPGLDRDRGALDRLPRAGDDAAHQPDPCQHLVERARVGIHQGLDVAHGAYR